ncbi:MAG TPA: PIG-L family deacetylase, partial [Labilithrix sp.]
ADPPVPAIGADFGDDVAFYTAHPDDEAMYAGGTLAALAHAGRRVSLVVVSHGEGGRLLVSLADGGTAERRDLPPADVARLRDDELARAMHVAGVPYAHLYAATDAVDYGFTTSCREAMAHWDSSLPGGLGEMLARIVDDIRAKRPRVVVTMDPRDDPQGSRHGHHRAVGTMVELAARAAADPRVVRTRPPHSVAEVLAFAPRDAHADVTIATGSAARVAMLAEHRSQFVAPFEPLAYRDDELFVVRWRARGASAVDALEALLRR